MRKHDDRHFGEPKLLSGENAAVAGNDHIVGADQHQVLRTPNSAIEPALLAQSDRPNASVRCGHRG